MTIGSHFDRHRAVMICAFGVAMLVELALIRLSAPVMGMMMIVTVGFVVKYRTSPPPYVILANRAAADAARRQYGRSHISSFVTMDDKHVVDLGDGAVVAFRHAFGVAVVAGDALTGDELQPAAIARFVDFAAARGWATCFYQSSADLRGVYQSRGFRVVKFGEEAVVELKTFGLEGSSRGNLRREVGRARRAGLSVKVTRAWMLTNDDIRDVECLSSEWMQGRGDQMGFSLGSWDDSMRANALVSVVRDDQGVLQAFTTWLPLGHDGIALDLMRRATNAKCGAIDLCIAQALLTARDSGIARASLGLVALRNQLNDTAETRIVAKVRRFLYGHALAGYRCSSLDSFKSKFAPEWVSKDVAYCNGNAGRIMLALAMVHKVKSVAAKVDKEVRLEMERAA